MTEVIEWVFYHPPKSRSFGHGSRLRDTRRTWDQTKAFLCELTDAGAPLGIELTCRATSQYLSAEVAEERQLCATGLFGSPNRNDSINGACWSLVPEQLEDAVSFELTAVKPPAASLPSSRLHFHYRFRWRSWPGPSADGGLGNSRLGVHLAAGLFLFQPGLVFPAALETSVFREQLIAIEAAAPFRLSDGNFKRWLIPASGNPQGRYQKPNKDWPKAWSVG